MQTVDLPPSGAALMGSLRGLGYSLPAALADLVDNSVSAGATEVRIFADWRDGDPTIEVLDDGKGMTRDTLVGRAMRLGGAGVANNRHSSDLGRFGLGLKTASLSQGTVLTVASKERGGTTCSASWDLDLVVSTDQWRLIVDPVLTMSESLRCLNASVSGTLVRVERIDRYLPLHSDRSRDAFLAAVRESERHLAATFHRFIERGLVLKLGRTTMAGVAPFPTQNPGTIAVPPLTLGEGSVRVAAFIMPADVDCASGQGFHVYRGDRLLTHGGWLGLGQPMPWTIEDQFRLCRIAIDLATSSDSEWSIDVRKSGVKSPAAYRDALTRYANRARAEARRVLHTKFAPHATARPSSVDPVWVPRGDGTYEQRINRSHPEISKLLRALPASEAALRLIEREFPNFAGCVGENG